MEAPIQRRRRYSDEEKAKALALHAANSGSEYPIAATANALRIPDSTLESWLTGRGVSQRALEIAGEEKKTLADLYDEVAVLSVMRQIIRLKDADSCADARLAEIAQTGGIAVDKSRLLRDLPTTITDNRNDAALREKAEALLARLLPEYGGDRAAALAAFREHAPTLSAYVN